MRILLIVLALAAGTTKIVYSPFHGDVDARSAPAGHCTYGSEILARWDAWSCVSGSKRLDPCFSKARTQVVVCVTSPWSKRRAIMLTKPLPQSLANVVGDPRAHAPWALALTDGQRCVRSKTPAYRCTGGVVLRGQVDRSQRVWRLGDSAIARAYW